jgi:two-component system, OmpR family, response regulator ChvI
LLVTIARLPSSHLASGSRVVADNSDEENNNNNSYRSPQSTIISPLSPFEYDSKSIEREEICFLNRSNNYCVSVVDIVDSTTITMELTNAKDVKAYYKIFLNSVATIAKNFGGEIIKNIGDALIFYFPQTYDHGNRDAFKDVLECSTALIAARDIINMKLHVEMLPPISYRVSADYGSVEIAASATSGTKDLFGSTMNICAKINSRAEPNGIVIGRDLYCIIKSLSSFYEYKFKEIKKNRIGKYLYPIYTVAKKDKPTMKQTVVDSDDNKAAKSRSLLFNKATKPESSMTEVITEDSSSSFSCSPSLHANRIMLVDDELDVLSVFELFLSSEGFDHVEKFSDPYEALQSYAENANSNNHYELIILDIRMPGMNGLQLYQRLRAINKDAKVIFLSALEATKELTSVLEGIESFDVIKKPIDKARFIKKVKASIRA